ncbi:MULTISPECIES: GNAT family N-acetyltransferase [unclassified Lacticaseibacillus]|uniref:GNAT family N-acetyltransferase n=1 Tax=unclassified Lacticaseibacillus TaxID=2759744 RepID=UPI001940D38C|nr:MULTISPECIES: GNAT family N-acetyltransferase [unclassified Lacticaseibacillus]
MIRVATVADLPKVVSLFHDYYQTSTVPHEFDDDRMLGFLKERLANQQAGLLVAEQGGQVVGFALLYVTQNTRDLAPQVIINDVFVAAQFRRHGIARQLMTASFVWGRQHGAKHVSWQTRTTNAAAQPLYDQLGQRESGWIHYDRDLTD